jgi:primosomal protein N' (replication factor Y) (superfamily II helicase)
LSFVQVAVALPVHGGFTYAVPPELVLALGHVVQVRFGRQLVTGYVIALQDHTEFARTRPVSRLLDPEPAFDAEQLRFFEWIASYYLSGLGEVISTALPSQIKVKTRRVYVPTDAGIEGLAQASDDASEMLLVLREVIARPGRTRGGVARVLHQEVNKDNVRRLLESLVRKEWVAVEERSTSQSRRIRTVNLEVPADALPLETGARMRGVLAHLVEAGGLLDLNRLVELEGQGARSAVKRLEAKGLVSTGDREDRAASGDAVLEDNRPPPDLNPAQVAAVEAIGSMSKGTTLLHGVTGSGKTEVYLRAAGRVLDQDKQVLVLVPEIALTPQLVGRFRGRFGERVAVLHSGLTPSDRIREWRRIRAREADVAIGARSALFAPFQDLGLLVVDEEHDGSYKQDDGVRYQARDLAVVRGSLAGCPVVLGSATPSVESWQNAQDGRYTRLLLPERATPRPLPSVELIDMRGRKPGNPLSSELIEALRATLSSGAQAIVLYNRRGYAPVVECPGCGGSYQCPSCGVGSLVLHHRKGQMLCHYCGFRRAFERQCGICDTQLEILGYGTERVEEALQEAFPDTQIARMDADTTRERGSHQRILSAFRDGEQQILVGTQLVAKGHDFPGVQLSAVVGVDHLLSMPDFRSAERTHALVTQLAGRAGRGERTGRVLIQTRHPDHFVFHHINAHNDLDAFYTAEAHQRRVLAHPPFSRIVITRVEGADLDKTRAAAELLTRKLRAEADGQTIQVFGPTMAPLSRLVGRWRMQIILRGRDVPAFRRWLHSVTPILLTKPKGAVRTLIDVDARSLL